MVQYRAAVDRAFAALASPTRRAVLEHLGSGSATVSELAELFDMSLPAMKRHIQQLEEAKFLVTEKPGRSRHCRVAPGAAVHALRRWLEQIGR